MTTRDELVGLAERIVNAPTGWLPIDGEVKNITFLPSELTLINAALRLASRQEASVEELATIIENEIVAIVYIGDENAEADGKPAARALLAKYSITKREG